MKLALPIALVAYGVILLTILMSHRHWEPRNWDNTRSDQNQINEAKQKWFQTHPDVKAEEAAVNQKYQQAEDAWRQAGHDKYEANAALVNHDYKLHQELIKSDPALQVVCDRLDLDKHVPFDWGDQQLAVEYGGDFIDGGRPAYVEHYIIYLFVGFPAVAFVTGIFLLYRLPSLAGAHLFLVFLMLPLVCFCPILLQEGMDIYLIRFNTLGDMGGWAEVFLQIHKVLAWTYLAFVPSLLIYIILLFRIHSRDQRAVAQN